MTVRKIKCGGNIHRERKVIMFRFDFVNFYSYQYEQKLVQEYEQSLVSVRVEKVSKMRKRT